MRRSSIVVALLLSLLIAASVAAKGPRSGADVVWLAPDFAAHEPTTIAMLPVATYDNNADARKQTEAAVGLALRGTGYVWASPLITRDRIIKAGGDSLLRALNARLLEQPRVDSLEAPFYARVLRATAFLTVRVDRYEKLELEIGQAGKPSTTVGLTIALVDSTGRLLWTAKGSETVEGPNFEPGRQELGVNANGLTNRPVTGQGGAPSFAESLNHLMSRWAPQFPARAGTAPAAPATP